MESKKTITAQQLIDTFYKIQDEGTDRYSDISSDEIFKLLDEKYEIREKEEKTIWVNLWVNGGVYSTTTFENHKDCLEDIEKYVKGFSFIKTIKTSILI